MNKFFSTLYFILLNIIVLNSNAQMDYRPGYIVKPNGETESGFINFRSNTSNSKHCYFKKDSLADAIEYSPADLLAYRFTNSKYYESKKVPLQNEEKNYFLECLISGKVSVYYLELEETAHYFAEKDHIFREISNDEIPYEDNEGNKGLRRTNQYKGVLKYYFQDCPQVLQKVNDADLDKKTLVKLSKQYHEYVCKDQQCIVYEKSFSRKSIGFSVDFSYGFKNINLYMSTFGSMKAQSDYEYAFNVSAFTNLNENKTTFFQLALGFSQFHSTQLTGYDLQSLNILPGNFTYQYSVLRITPTLKHKLKYGKISPFFAIGAPVGIFLNDKGSLLNTKKNQNVNFTRGGFYNQKGDEFIFGLTGELGAEYPLSGNRRSVFLSLFFERLQTYIQLRNNNFGIKTGICF